MGTASPPAPCWPSRPAAAAIADVLPKGELRQIPTADHTLTAEAVVPVMRKFARGTGDEEV